MRLEYLAVALLVWNLAVFAIFGIDKSKAKRGDRRVSEIALLLIAFFLGAVGALAGMLVFRHKTRKLKFKILVPIAFLLNAAIAIGGGYMMTMANELTEMSPIPTGEFLPGIYAVESGYVNCFLIRRGDKYIMIDAGMSVRQLEDGLATLGISADDVGAVLMTHTHGDHTAGLQLVDGVDVYGMNPDIANVELSDGETFEILGAEFMSIATPGHTYDSVSYLYDGRYLFSGDNLSLQANNVGLFVSVFNDSDAQQEADIAKLARLDGVEYIVTSHHGFTDNPIFP